MPKRSSADPAKVAAAVHVVLDGTLSQRTAGKRYGVPKTTLRRAVEKAREGMGREEPEGRADEVVRTGPDQRTGIGPERTGANHPSLIGAGRVPEVVRDARLTAPQMLAASMVVAAQHSHAEIAAEAGMGTTTLTRLKRDPVFQAVCDDLRAACHMRARERLARGAEIAIEALAAGAALHRELNTEALDLLRRFRDGEEGLELSEVRRAVGLAVEASKMTPQSRGLMDAGGFPKTERVEVSADQNPAERIGRAQQRAAGLGLRLITTENPS